MNDTAEHKVHICHHKDTLQKHVMQHNFQKQCNIRRKVDCIVQEEAKLAAIQNDVQRGPSDAPGGKAIHATQRMANCLEQLWVHLNRQQHFGRLLAAAKQLHMPRVQLPLRILQVCSSLLLCNANLTLDRQLRSVENCEHQASCLRGQMRGIWSDKSCPLAKQVLLKAPCGLLPSCRPLQDCCLRLLAAAAAAGPGPVQQRQIKPQQLPGPGPAPAALLPSW